MAKPLLRSLLQVSLFLHTVKALVALQPTPVSVVQLDLRANPKPTPRAILAEEDSHLLGRNYYNTLCGYISGNLNYPVTCDSGSICATANNYQAAGCCNDLAYCNLPSTCIPYGGICDEACLEDNAYYTSCGYLAPYCLTGVYEYSALYYEYVCGTVGGIVTIYTSAFGVATQNVVNSVAMATQTIATTTGAVAAEQTGNSGSSITIDCGSGSSCGNGNGDSGNGNGAGNKSAASTQTAALSLHLLSLVCAVMLAWL